METQNKPRQLTIKASDEKIKGEYSNVLQVYHTKEEYVLDFLSVLPPTGTLVSRIVVSPVHFKRMLLAMEDNLKKYEQKFGSVSPSEEPNTIGFQMK